MIKFYEIEKNITNFLFFSYPAHVQKKREKFRRHCFTTYETCVLHPEHLKKFKLLSKLVLPFDLNNVYLYFICEKCK